MIIETPSMNKQIFIKLVELHSQVKMPLLVAENVFYAYTVTEASIAKGIKANHDSRPEQLLVIASEYVEYQNNEIDKPEWLAFYDES